MLLYSELEGEQKGMPVVILAVNGSSHGGSTVNMALATCDTYAPSSCV